MHPQLPTGQRADVEGGESSEVVHLIHVPSHQLHFTEKMLNKLGENFSQQRQRWSASASAFVRCANHRILKISRDG
jgi:hypothetical protein